jgi:UDP-2,3-diacylglucosamine pyrophosphatase LpxH
LTVIVVSDQHLGYQNSDKQSFNSFLEELKGQADITDLVLLGDVVDMWRRDASGVFLENRDTLDIIGVLQQRMNVHYIAGNHDYHVLQLQDHSYPFQFLGNLTLSDGNRTLRFLHGHEFDPLQQPPLMEALCRTMFDGGGGFESGAWATLTRDWSDARYFLSLIFSKRGIRKKVETLQTPPEARLKNTLGDVERQACASVGAGEVLVFGHTHRPFVNKSENVVNSGSWVTDAPVHNTYVRIEAGKPRLFIYRGDEITQREEC